VDGTIQWQERTSSSGTVHPEVERFAEVIGKLTQLAQLEVHFNDFP
jgi:hypothetical protein